MIYWESLGGGWLSITQEKANVDVFQLFLMDLYNSLSWQTIMMVTMMMMMMIKMMMTMTIANDMRESKWPSILVTVIIIISITIIILILMIIMMMTILQITDKEWGLKVPLLSLPPLICVTKFFSTSTNTFQQWLFCRSQIKNEVSKCLCFLYLPWFVSLNFFQHPQILFSNDYFADHR